MRTLSAIAGSAVLILSGSPGPGQQPGPGTDPTVLERPHPLAVAENADPSDLISKLSAKLKSQGFSVAANKKEFFVEARKYFDTQSPKDYDRVILWLARDVKDPSRYINVYFLFGRYEEMFGRNGKAVYRVAINTDEEERLVGALKQELIDIMTTGAEHK